MKKKAFTLIELIVMIVVIGIAFMTLPIILMITTAAIENTVESRGFYHGVAKTKAILSKPWDENNVDDFATSGIYYVLNTDEDSGGLVCENNKNRSGHYAGQNRRMCEASYASSIQLDGEAVGFYDDIDDFHQTSGTVSDFVINSNIEYIAYQSGSVVANLAPSATTSNIKLVTVTVLKDGKTVTEYKYYATNIGLPRPYIKPN